MSQKEQHSTLQNKDTHYTWDDVFREFKNDLVVVVIDDVHPEKGWGVEGDVQVEYLKTQ